jgi:hypothetical protein
MATDKFAEALKDESEVELTVTGRRSGRKSSRPVWFAQDGDKVFLLPVGGSSSNWYRNALKTPNIRLKAHGVSHEAKASPITTQAGVRDVLGKFRAKYGAQSTSEYTKQDVAVEARID